MGDAAEGGVQEWQAAEDDAVVGNDEAEFRDCGREFGDWVVGIVGESRRMQRAREPRRGSAMATLIGLMVAVDLALAERVLIILAR